MRFPIYYLLRLSSDVFLLICLAACDLFFLVSVLPCAWQPCRLFFLASVLLCFPAYSAVVPATVPSKAATVSPACFVLSSSSPRPRGFPSMFPGFTGSRDCDVLLWPLARSGVFAAIALVPKNPQVTASSRHSSIAAMKRFSLRTQKAALVGCWRIPACLVRAVKEMDSESIGLCPQGLESPRCRNA